MNKNNNNNKRRPLTVRVKPHFSIFSSAQIRNKNKNKSRCVRFVFYFYSPPVLEAVHDRSSPIIRVLVLKPHGPFRDRRVPRQPARTLHRRSVALVRHGRVVGVPSPAENKKTQKKTRRNKKKKKKKKSVPGMSFPACLFFLPSPRFSIANHQTR